MKIPKVLIAASLRIAVAMGVVVCAAAVLTVPAHAKAIGETPNRSGGSVTVYDNPCPGVDKPGWFVAESYSLGGDVVIGCWTVQSREKLRVLWPIETKDGTFDVIPVDYNVDGFHNPHNM